MDDLQDYQDHVEILSSQERVKNRLLQEGPFFGGSLSARFQSDGTDSHGQNAPVPRDLYSRKSRKLRHPEKDWHGSSTKTRKNYGPSS
jgi:hypothetical protein